MTTLNSPISRRGFMLALSSPSGVGKTTVTRKVLELDTTLALSVSVTTRPPRPSEIDGKDYHFVDEKTFVEMREADHFLETACIYGNYYGTPRAQVEEKLEAGVDVLFDIDWQGTQQLSQTSRANLVSIFLLPPTSQTLEERLRKRAEDTEDTIRLRLSKASTELSHWPEYDYVFICHTVKEGSEAVQSIIQAERLKRHRQVGLASFITGLQQQTGPL